MDSNTFKVIENVLFLIRQKISQQKIINIDTMVKIGGGDGSSFEKAIIISDCNNTEGIKQEYIEVRKRFGNCELIRQILLEHNNKLFDKLELKLEDGREIELYFEITKFFGKGFEF